MVAALQSEKALFGKRKRKDRGNRTLHKGLSARRQPDGRRSLANWNVGQGALIQPE